MRCPGCGQEQCDANKFCEDCGASLRGPARPAAARDRLERVAAPHLAGVSDRGNCHRRNDDFLALAAHERGDVLVVCDGVSSSSMPDVAAEVGAEAARDALLVALRAGAAGPAALGPALAAADAAVRALPCRTGPGEEPPETTIVAALRQGRRLTLSWLGDSRAYLFAPGLARQLTEDHSWVNEVVAAGEMTPAEALRAPQAHCVTRTLGGPGAGDVPAWRGLELPDGPGWLLLCTDGLWNYAPAPEQLAEVVRRHEGAAALDVARALVGHALRQRGHDNVTAAVLAFNGPR
jgi:serine/threonine protein phosphatase PrpC